MEWDTGRIIAVFIILLLIAAIFWFMTRAGRKRAAARYDEAQGRPRAAQDPAHPGARAHASDAERGDDSSNTSASAAPPVDTYGSGAAGGTLGVSALAATGVGAAALGAAVSAGRDGERSETGTVMERAADANADPDADPDAGVPRGTTADAHADAAATAPPRGGDRPRFDSSNDGHPLPEREADASAGTTGSSQVDAVRGPAPVAFSAPDVELKATDGAIRSQGSGEAVADVAPGAPGAPERGLAPADAPVSDASTDDGTDAPQRGPDARTRIQARRLRRSGRAGCRHRLDPRCVEPGGLLGPERAADLGGEQRRVRRQRTGCPGHRAGAPERRDAGRAPADRHRLERLDGHGLDGHGRHRGRQLGLEHVDERRGRRERRSRGRARTGGAGRGDPRGRWNGHRRGAGRDEFHGFLGLARDAGAGRRRSVRRLARAASR